MAHYEDAKLVLKAGKHCLLEKVCRILLKSWMVQVAEQQPATLNAAEWKDLSRIATEKGLFLMEGQSRIITPLDVTPPHLTL